MSTNYPGNSNRKHNEEEPKKKKVDKVVTGSAKKRKKPLSKKLAETFVGEDIESVGQYVLFDVIVPAAKSTIADATSQAIERMLFGESRKRPGQPGRVHGNYTPYNRSSGSTVRTQGSGRDISRRARATHDFDEIIIDTRGEAEEVLDRLGDLIDMYDHATVSDLYDLVGITGNWTDDKWGWFDIREANIARVRSGYLLNLPKPVTID